MSRTYKVTFEGVAVSAAQDLFQLIGATGKICRLLRAKIACTDTTAPTDQQLEIRVQFLPATVTNGSGGSSPTPQKTDPGDAAASFTAKANSTTQATTNGTAVTIDEDGFNIKAGWDNYFPDKPPFGPSESMVLGLLSTVTGTVHLSGTTWVEELGG